MPVTRVTYYQDPNLNSIPYSVRPYTGGRSFYVPSPQNPYYSNYVPPKDYVLDYNNPLKLNSLADLLSQAVLNNMSSADYQTPLPFGLDKYYGGILDRVRAADKVGQLDWTDIGQVLLAPLHLLRTSAYDPIVGKMQSEQGMNKLSGFGDMLLNTLGNFGETMDILANPVKGAILDKDGPLKGVERGLGLGSDGRVNYEYNTGSKLTDVGLELISDPFNWVSLGAWAGGKAIAGAGAEALQQALKTSAREVGKDLSDDALTFMTEQGVRQLRKNPDDLVGVANSVLMSAGKPSYTHQAYDIANDLQFGDALRGNIVRTFQDSAQGSRTTAILSGLQRLSKGSDEIQSVMTKAVGWTSGITPTFKLTRLIADPIAGAVHTAARNALVGAQLPIGYVPLTKFEPTINTVKDTGSKFFGDHAEQYTGQLLATMRLNTVSQDLSKIYEITQAKGDILAKLNTYFQETNAMDFPEYVEYVRQMSERIPDLEYHYHDLYAIQKLAEDNLLQKATQKKLRVLRKAKETIDAATDVAFSGLMENGIPPSRLEEISRGLQSLHSVIKNMAADPANQGNAVYDRVSKAINALRWIYKTVAEEGPAKVVEYIESPRIRTELEHSLQDLGHILEDTDDMLKDSQQAARDALLNTSYRDALQESYAAGKNAPFYDILRTDDFDDYTEAEILQRQARLKYWQDENKIPALADKLADFLERAVLDKNADYQMEILSRAIQDFEQEPFRFAEHLADLLDSQMDNLAKDIDLYESKSGNDDMQKLMQILEDLRSSLDPLVHVVVGDRTYNLMNRVVEYAFKESQAFAALQLLDTDAAKAINDLAQQVILKTGLGAKLNQLTDAEPTRELVNSIQGRAWAHQSYVHLLNTLRSDPLLSPLFGNIFDTMQTWKLKDFDKVMAHRSDFLKNFIDKLQVQLNAVSSKTRNALDKLFEEGTDLQKGFAAYLAAHAPQELLAHDAQYDVLRVMYLFEREDYCASLLQELDLEHYLPVFYDIETTGLKEGSDQLLQIAWRTFDGTSGNIRTRIPKFLVPDHELLAKLTDPSLSRAEQLAMFRARWNDAANPDQLQALQQFLDAMRQLEDQINPPGTQQIRRVRLVGWNNATFDDPFLESLSWKNTGTLPISYAQYFQGLPKYDALKQLYAKRGVAQLSEDQVRTLRQYLSAYLDRRFNTETEWLGKRHFIDSLDGGFATDLQKISRILREQEAGGLTGEGMTEARGALGALGFSFRNAWDELDDAANEIWDTLKAIKSDNEALKGKHIVMDSAGRFLDVRGNEIQLPGVLNVSQIMADEAGVLMQGAVKTVYNGSWVHRVFEGLNLTDEIGRISRDQFFAHARSVVRLSDAVRNTGLATQYYEQFGQAAETLVNLLKRWSRTTTESAPMFLDHIEPRLTGTFDRYAQAQQLYNRLRRVAAKNGYTRELDDLLKTDPTLKDVARIFSKPQCMMSAHGVFAEDVYTSTFWALKEQPFLHNIRQYTKELSSGVPERLEQASMLRDIHGLRNASSQAGYAVLTRYDRAWKNIMDYIFEDTDQAVRRMDDLEGDLLTYANHFALSNLEWLAKMPADKLEKYLWMANGRVTFSTPFDTAEAYAAFMDGVYETFRKRSDDLLKNNVHVQYDEGTQRMWLWLDSDKSVVDKWLNAEHQYYVAESARVTEANKNLAPGAAPEHFRDWYAEFYQDLNPYFRSDVSVPKKVWDSFEDIRRLTADLTRGRSVGTMGDMSSKETLRDLDAAAPEYLRHKFISLDVFGAAEHFGTFGFNRSNLGMLRSRQEIGNYLSGNIIKNYMNTAQSLVDIMDTRTKMTYMFFDDNHSLASGFYKDLSPDEMLEMLKAHPELRLAGLIQDPKYGAIVRECKAHTADDIRYYMAHPDLHVTLMPVHTFIQAHQAINNFRVGGSWMQALNHWVIGPMKTGYLTSLGFVFRNIVDSMVKNLMLAGEPEDAYAMTKHTLETVKYYGRYKQIFEEMQNYSDGEVKNMYGMYSKRILHRMYEKDGERLNALMSEDLFQLFHDFIEQGPSAGMTKLQQDAIWAKRNKNLARQGLPPPKDDLATILMKNPASTWVMSVNSDLEQIFRLSGYTWALKEGATTDNAMQAVFRHHFDYSTKSKAEMYAEYVIPFNSFTIHNTKYWFDAVDRYGWMAGMYRDFYSPYWDFQNRDEDEMARNRSLQYHILAGNLILNESGLVLKLSPSAMDAVRMLSDPEEMISRMAFYLKIPLQLLIDGINGMDSEDWLKLVITNIPMIGPQAYRWWPEDGTVFKGLERLSGPGIERAAGRILVAAMPSIFGAVNFWDDYVRTPYIKKLKARKTYVRKYYPKKYYPRRSKRGYSRRAYFRKSFVPRSNARNVMAKVLSTARGHQMRMPGSQSTMTGVSPRLYRRIYSGTGRDRFRSRMLPVTAQNLASRLRSDWAYLR